MLSTLVSSALVLLALAGQSQAVDIRAYTANSCRGVFVGCNNIGPSVCCSSSSWAAASMQLANTNPAINTFTVYGFPACAGPSHSEFPGNCFTPSFAVFSGRYTWFSARRDEPSGAEECVEPDTFGYFDDAGDAHEANIPEGKKKEILAAFSQGDVEAIKAAL